jgi:hypothetical protein
MSPLLLLLAVMCVTAGLCTLSPATQSTVPAAAVRLAARPFWQLLDGLHLVMPLLISWNHIISI